MKHIKVVGFDCDGVLFDTRQANRAFYNQILDYFGKKAMTDEQFAYIHMHTLDESLNYLFPDQDSLAAIHDYRRSMDYRWYLQLLTVEPHLIPLLNKIRPKRKTAIVTNRTDTMNALLTEFGLDGYFDLVVTSTDVKRPKPHPDALFKVLAYFDIEPQQAIYIGDSKLDELAAAAAGIPLVAYCNQDLSSAYHIQSLKDIEQLLMI